MRQLRELDLSLWERNNHTVLVDASGRLHLRDDETVRTLGGQAVSHDVVDLVAPFTTGEGTQGPDLISPRPELRILPGKLSGSPHVVHTRLETRVLFALGSDGFDLGGIRRLYPYVTAQQIGQALDLEKQLDANLVKRAA